MNGNHESGFTLLELIMVMVVLALASVPILSQFTQVARSTVINEEIQTATQLAQERAEEIILLRRAQGYSAVATGTTVDVLPVPFSQFSRSVVVADSTASADCPTTGTCKSVRVRVGQGTKTRADIYFLILDY